MTNKYVSQGQLFIVATPIGNLSDITHRAVEVLQSVDVIAAEDTRHSKYLLQHYQIKTHCIALHEHNEAQQTQRIIEQLTEGRSVALISDAGTPLISDPGYQLVKQVSQQGHEIVPIPGPSALIAGLCVSGLATDRFVFEGFLPVKTKGRLERLENLRQEPRTIIFYESPHRILEFLQQLIDAFGPEREAAIARELTKKFETIYRGSLQEILQPLEQHAEQQQGEFVVMLSGAAKCQDEEIDTAQRIATVLAEELPVKQAAALAAKITGVKKNALYQFLIG